MGRLSRRIFERYTPTVARALLGTRLVRVVGGKRLSGIIVETEAYRGRRDPAESSCLLHRFPGDEWIFRDEEAPRIMATLANSDPLGGDRP